MHSEQLRSLVCLALVSTFLVAIPSQAQRRRSVEHPTPALSAKISGTVLDNVTGQPVFAAKVTAGSRSDSTDPAGKFSITKVSDTNGTIVVEASRTGYLSKSITLTTGGEHTLTFRLDPGATIRVTKTDGTVSIYDLDSIEFGFPVLFSGYRKDTFDSFCKPGGAMVDIDRSEFKKITGPATLVTFTPCCSTATVLKINAELKTGETTDLYFMDACDGNTGIELIGREHVGGHFTPIRFTDIREIVFP